ncbi:MAG: O-antigen ligase family protein [Patescibacteria group bacterium]|nr:O-antigen ligase family protein [Patescibacteria group bacterium]
MVAVAIGFINPIAMSLTEVLLGVMAGCWLLAGGYRERMRAIVCNPVALATLAMLALITVSLLYGEAPWSHSLRGWAKYRNLVYLVLFITIFRTAKMREAGLWAFGLAMVLTLVFSYLTAAGMPPIENRYTLRPHNAVVFRNHIVHGLCMGLFAYLMAHRFAEQPRRRWYLGVLCLLAMVNVLFMVASRTGYITLAVMIPLFCVQRLRLRTLVAAGVAVVALGVVGHFHSEIFTQRLQDARAEVEAYLAYHFGDGPIKPEGWRRPVTRTSCGVRLEWYRIGLEMMKERPLLGVGAGSVHYHMQQSSKKGDKHGAPPTDNLHSEYVMFAAQNGVPGLVLFGIFLVAYWRSRRKLSPRMRQLAEGTLLMLMVAGTANTLLTERTEGVLFVFCAGLAFAELSERAVRQRWVSPEHGTAAADETAPDADLDAAEGAPSPLSRAA